ncbi:unnamed protein product, partial [Ixodes hexagonus]
MAISVLCPNIGRRCILALVTLIAVVPWSSTLTSGAFAATPASCGNETTSPPAMQMLSPTPLDRPNASAVQMLQRRADELSNAVSNTSFAESRSNVTVYEIRHSRKKQQQLMLIRAQILHRLGIRNPASPSNGSTPLNNSTLRLVEQIVRIPPAKTMATAAAGGELTTARTVYSERIQSFYPACSLPNNTDLSAWHVPGHMRLHYDVTFPRPSAGTEITLVSAKLRLYRLSDPRSAPPLEPGAHNFLDPAEAQRRRPPVTVSIFQFLKPVRSNRREKKQLIVSRTLSTERRGWEEFNVESAVSQWYRSRGKNHGLDIELHDALGNKLVPGLYFQNMSCTETAAGQQEPPFPNIMRLHPGLRDNESSLLDNETYPTLDLQVVEVLRQDGPSPQAATEPATLTSGAPAMEQGVTSAQQRRRRRTQDAGRRVCQRGSFYVTFAELGLDNVLHPEGFTYLYCYGRCGCKGDGRKRGSKANDRPCIRKVS